MRLKITVAFGLKFMGMNKNACGFLLIERLPGDLTVDNNVTANDLNSFTGQTGNPFDIGFSRARGISKYNDLPSSGRVIQVGLLVDEQLVSVISGNIRNINSRLAAIGTDRAGTTGHDRGGIRVIIRIVGGTERKSESAGRTDDSFVIAQQRRGHRSRGDHVTFCGTRSKQQNRDEQGDEGLNQCSKGSALILLEFERIRFGPSRQRRRRRNFTHRYQPW